MRLEFTVRGYPTPYTSSTICDEVEHVALDIGAPAEELSGQHEHRPTAKEGTDAE